MCPQQRKGRRLWESHDHIGKYGSNFLLGHGISWNPVKEGRGMSWKVTEGCERSRKALKSPWNAVRTNDREVELHGSPWKVM